MNHFVLPRGQQTPIIPFAKTNGTKLAMSAQEFTLLLSTIFLCKHTKVMWLCKSKGFHNSFLRVYCTCTNCSFSDNPVRRPDNNLVIRYRMTRADYGQRCGCRRYTRPEVCPFILLHTLPHSCCMVQYGKSEVMATSTAHLTFINLECQAHFL